MNMLGEARSRAYGIPFIKIFHRARNLLIVMVWARVLERTSHDLPSQVSGCALVSMLFPGIPQ